MRLQLLPIEPKPSSSVRDPYHNYLILLIDTLQEMNIRNIAIKCRLAVSAIANPEHNKLTFSTRKCK